MVIKIKFIWIIITSLFAIAGTVVFLNAIISDSELSFYEWFVYLTGIPLFVIGSIFILPTKKITLTPEKLSVYWKIAIGAFKIYESNHYQIYWRNVKNISSILPL